MSEITSRLSTALADRYRIEHLLGEGGMATVYLAEDLRHERKVALKVLRPELAAVLGADRFVQEIKTTASLQHPNILPLFDSGEADGFLFYVMPYIEGETLRDRLNRETQLAIDDALSITTEVAGALDSAHRQGVIHRDIKPENILLHDGRALVADFGIALAVSAAAGGRMTETGLSLGTPHYMSPEQATAEKELTARSDIYSLGSVLYEMLTGNPPHVGASAQQIIMKIVTEEAAPITSVRKSVPAHVAAAVAMSLEKLAADRFASASAFVEALHNPAFTASTTTTVSRRTDQSQRSWKRVALAAIAVAVVSLGTTVRTILRPEPSRPVTRAEIDLGDIALQSSGDVLVSPDGERFALVGTAGGPIYWRESDGAEFRAIPGTEDAEYAAFSPDGRSLVFAPNSGPTLRRVALSGGAPVTVAVTERGAGGLDWGDDGHVVFSESGGHGLYRVPAAGGDVEMLLGPDVDVRNPKVLPGGDAIIFTGLGSDGWSTQMVDVRTRAVTTLRQGAIDAVYVDLGYLVYTDLAGTLWAARFDPAARELRSEPFTIFDGVAVFGTFYARFAISRTGTLVHMTGGASGTGYQQLLLLDFDGQRQELPLSPRRFNRMRWSPNGPIVAYDSPTGEGISIFTYDIVLGSAPRRLTPNGDNVSPVWSPDGNRVAFGSRSRSADSGPFKLTVANLEEDGASRVLLSLPGYQIPTDWPAPDTLVFESRGLWILDMTGDSAVAHPYLTPEERVSELRVSPSGTFAVYRSGADGLLYVRTYPTAGARVQISSQEATSPFWSPDGNTIYYFLADFNASRFSVAAARVRAGPPFSVVATDTVYQTDRPGGWALHPDGRQFLYAPVEVRESAAGASERFLVVTNWFEELLRREGT